MTPDEQQEFERRFRHRQEMFLSALVGLASAHSTWQAYRDEQEINDDGEFTSLAIKEGNASSDLAELKRYCTDITAQGYHLEVAMDVDSDFHVVAWEEYQPDWTEELDPVLFLRWNILKPA